MNKLANIPIRTQLIVLAVLLTLPALGIIIYSGLKERDYDYRNATIESQKLADNLSAEIVNLTHDAQQLGGILSDLPDIKNYNTVKVQSILAGTLKRYPQYSAILIANASGSVWATTYPLPPNTSVAEKSYFKKAMLTNRISSGEFVISMSKQAPVIHIACPLVDRNKFCGVVILEYNLEVLKYIIERSYLAKTTNYVVTDRNGTILSRGKNIGANVGEHIRPAELKIMEKGPDKDTYEFVRVDGEHRIVTYRKLWLEGEQTPYIYVRAGLSIKEALSKANSNLFHNITILLPFVVFSFFLVVIIGKRSIADRVTLLKLAAEQFARGDLDFKVSERISGGELGVLGQTFDDMAHQLALREQALQESERNYRDIFNMTHDAIFVHDEKTGEIIEVNKTAEQMFGYSSEEILQILLVDFNTSQAQHPLHETLNWLQESVKESPREFERLIKKKSGDFFWIDVVQLATSIAGKRRILSIVRDITERKEIERVKDEMLSAVSHEMRTPLTAILGFLEFIIENPVGVVQIKNYLEIIHKEAGRLNELIDNFLDMQRLKAKLKSYVYEPLDVRQLIEEAAAIFTIPNVNYNINIDLPLVLPLILGVESLLHQTLVNLISNAIKYSSDDCEVTIGAIANGNYVTIWVRDNGIGIPAESIDNIFDVFFRVNNTSVRRTNGTGLGLAVVKEAVSEMNGKVWVESTLGEGSTFYISLPIAVNSDITETAF
jgi:PAS domain S-box-containing protein